MGPLLALRSGSAPHAPPPIRKGFLVRRPRCARWLTSAAALPRGQDNGDEQQDEEQQGGQHVAQLLEEVCSTLRDDDVDDAAATC